MTRIYVGLVFLAMLCAVQCASAAEWVTLGMSENGNVAQLVDVSSIRITGTIRKV
jgi:hypothetical protein